MNLRQRFTRLLPSSVVGVLLHIRSGGIFDRFARVSFAQEGEDLLLERIFDGHTSGFYVDIGAHHPTRFSNTYRLYRRGWRGINIDATPGSMARFKTKRSRDINLEIVISDKTGTRRLYQFDEPALNSVSAELAERRVRDTTYVLTGVVDLPARTLSDVLVEHLPSDVATIDLLTIDVEGHDFEVIRSNDWTEYRPRVLLIELLATPVQDLHKRSEIQYLQTRGYSVHSKLFNTVVLLDTSAHSP